MDEICCIGILVADVIVKTVDQMPSKGKLGLVNRMDLFSGGCAMNAAIDMAKIGLKVSLVGRIGNDGFGAFLKNSLIAEGVSVEGLVTDYENQTSASVVLSASDGERTFLHCLGANAKFCEKDVSLEIIDKANVVFAAGSLLMPSFDGHPCAHILEYAKKRGKITVLDTAWDSTGRWMTALEPCMKHIDYFMPSYEEAVALSGYKEPGDIAGAFMAMGARNVVIKLGIGGCHIKTADGLEMTLPSYDRIKAVDTTGAGDSFCAGFITGLVKGWSVVECARFANATGTHCVMKTGATTGIKPLADIQEFMRQYDAGLI